MLYGATDELFRLELFVFVYTIYINYQPNTFNKPLSRGNHQNTITIICLGNNKLTIAY